MKPNHKKKHSNILLKLLLYNQNQCNTVNKMCSLDLDVAYHIYLDIPNKLKPHSWHIALIMLKFYYLSCFVKVYENTYDQSYKIRPRNK